MKISRDTIINSIIRQSQSFPNCNLVRVGDDLFINCKDGQFKERIFRATFKDEKTQTYHENYEYLLNHPEIEIVELIKNVPKQIPVQKEIRKVFV